MRAMFEHVVGRSMAQYLAIIEASASSGDHDRARTTLGATGLPSWLEGRPFGLTGVMGP